MFSTICSHCGQTAHITPDQPHCPHCGQNLRDALPGDAAVRYFYERAANLATQEQVAEALAEAERGFAATQAEAGSSSLRLLAAMLAQRLDRPELMRHHVAHIELDDALRGEAEWLLRSHQAGRRSRRQLAKTRSLGPGVGRGQTFAPGQQMAVPQSAGAARHWSSLATLLAILLVGLGAWGGWRLLSPIAAVPESNGPTIAEEQPDVAQADAAGDMPDATDVGSSTVNTPAVTSTITPTETPVAEPQLAAGETAAAEILASQSFDWKTFLLEQDQTELAALPVDARLVGGRIRLQGSVETDEQRRQLVALAQSVPDVSEVNLVDLRLDLPATYTVRSGDTLWLIAYNLYGNPARVDDLFAANRNQLASPEALNVGQELVVPE